MQSSQRIANVAMLVVLTTATLALGESRKEFRFTVGAHANISIINQYGAISVKPSAGNDVVVIAVLQSDKVEVDQSKNGKRVDVVSHL